MSKPLFLIVTPSFNQAQFIKQTIDSVVTQKGDFEIAYVVMDGGSKDETKEILKKYSSVILEESIDDRISKKEQKDPLPTGRQVSTLLPTQLRGRQDDIKHQASSIRHFFYESKKDKGQTDAINKGINYFSVIPDHDPESNMDPRPCLPVGKVREDDRVIFAYINSDDYYLPNTFKKVVEAFDENPSKKWLVGDAIIIDENGNKIQHWVRVYKQMLRFIYRFFPSFLYILNPIPQPSTFIRRSAVNEIGDFDQKLRYVMDYQYWLRLQKRFGLPVFINQPLSYFRIHGLSKGGSQFDKQFAEQYKVAQKYTDNRLVLLLHQAHNWVTTSMYGLIKS